MVGLGRGGWVDYPFWILHFGDQSWTMCKNRGIFRHKEQHDEKQLYDLRQTNVPFFQKTSEIHEIQDLAARFLVRLMRIFKNEQFQDDYQGGPLYLGISQTNTSVCPQSGHIMGFFCFLEKDRLLPESLLPMSSLIWSSVFRFFVASNPK